jgi:two-component system response regulator
MMTKQLVLVVEDNDDDVELIKRALRPSSLSIDMVVTHNGLEAVDYLLQNGQKQSGHKQPVMVLLDLDMPELNGYGVLQKLRDDKRTRFLPIVVFSSSGDEVAVQKCYRYGANSYVSKPSSYDSFRTTVQQMVEYWLRYNETASEEAA